MKSLIFIALVTVSQLSFAIRESGGMIRGTSVYIEYTSIGSGIDGSLSNFINGLIGEAGMRGEVLEQTSEPYGMEGERLDCVGFKDGTQRYRFIKNFARRVLDDARRTGAQRTFVYVGAGCGMFSEATKQDLTAYIDFDSF